MELTAGREDYEEIFKISVGIPQASLEHHFKAFQRGSNVGEIHGPGLGMVIIKHCINLYG